MFSLSLSQSSSVLFAAAGLLAGLLLLSTTPAQAQPRGQAPAQQRAAPPSGGGQAPARTGRSGAVGTELPSSAEPSRPSSSFGQRPGGSNTPGGANAPGGTAQTNDPGTPGDPTQDVPLGGAEWLAAAGAAYALNRLRRSQGAEDEDEGSEDGMP